MPPEVGVLSIKFKVNFLAPAAGELFLARGQMLALAQGQEKLVALMQATMMAVVGQNGIRD
jgi:acyl-coenzyme A thioesterase PaaI-like protein